VVSGEYYSFLYVLRRSGTDADYWHTPLLAWNIERGVEVAALDRPVGKGVRLVVGVFGSARLIRTPDTVVPANEDVGAVSCGRVVAWGGRWDGADQWLRDFRCEGLELGIRRPTSRSRCTATGLGRLQGYRCQAESDGQERREEKHCCLVRLGCECTGEFEVIYTLERWSQCGRPRGLARQRPIQALRAALTIINGCNWAPITDYIELVVRYQSITKMID